MTEFQLSSDAAPLARSLHRAAEQLGELEPVNRRAGAIITAAPAPHRTGRLGAGVFADVTANGVTAAATAPYWTFVHWGAPARHVKAQPWLLEQTRTHQDDLVELYRDHASDVLADIES